jgi:hypothetical protein
MEIPRFRKAGLTSLPSFLKSSTRPSKPCVTKMSILASRHPKFKKGSQSEGCAAGGESKGAVATLAETTDPPVRDEAAKRKKFRPKPPPPPPRTRLQLTSSTRRRWRWSDWRRWRHAQRRSSLRSNSSSRNKGPHRAHPQHPLRLWSCGILKSILDV